MNCQHRDFTNVRTLRANEIQQLSLMHLAMEGDLEQISVENLAPAR
jgi:hypothetical protein